VLCQLGTRLSLVFEIGSGVSLIYLPITFGLAMTQWWGARALPGLYLNAVLSAGLWGLSRTWLWPVYAWPETAAVALGWWLFAGVGRGRAWLPAQRDVLSFVALSIVPAALVNALIVTGQLVALGDLSPDTFWTAARSSFGSDLMAGLALAVPVLKLLTPWLERQGWSLTRGASEAVSPFAALSRRDWVHVAMVLGAAVLASLVPSLTPRWFVFGTAVLWLGLRFGVGPALLANGLTLSLLLAPAAIATLGGFPVTPLSDSHAASIAVVTLACLAGLATGQTVTDLRTEIAHRRETEARLRDSEVHLRELIDVAPYPIAVLSTSGDVLELNRKFTDVFGYTRADIPTLEHWWLQAYRDPVYRAQVMEAWPRRIATTSAEQPEFEPVVATVSTKAGQPRDVEFRACRLGDQVVVMAADLTDHRRLEMQLRQAQKMEAVGTLAGGIAHDFNNIMTGVLGSAELARHELAKDHPAAELLDHIVRASERARDLTSRVLAFSRQQKPQRARVRLSALVDEVASLARASLPSTVVIEVDTPAAGDEVIADASQIHQVLLNLYTNAGHAMRGRTGRLRFRVRTDMRGEVAFRQHPDFVPGPYVALSVSDTGHGMDAETSRRIFDPFFTTKAPGEGTGLGLPVVDGIVRQHEGVILCDSQPGVGTTFTVYLPAAEGLPASAAPDTAACTSRGRGEHVFVVDDEVMLTELTGRMLTGMGYRCSTFTDAGSALDAFAANPSAVDLILTDLTMPRMTGGDLIAAVRRLRPDLPLVLATGFGAEEETEKVRGHEGVLVLAKPFRTHELFAIVEKALSASRPA
jgi:PAS domain S-box-containing protein